MTKPVIIIADPLKNFDPYNETTAYIMAQMTRQNMPVALTTLNDLAQIPGSLGAQVTFVETFKAKTSPFKYKLGETRFLSLTSVGAILLRKDPPVDSTFTHHLQILATLENKVPILNRPSGILLAPEKLLPLAFKKFSPPTLVSASLTAINDFARKYKEIVLKPLNLSGGRGIILTSYKNPSFASLVDLATAGGKNFIVTQKMVPKAHLGDKRILLIGNKVLGCFLRVPSKSDFRGNLHSGAKLKSCLLTANDKSIIQAILPTLKSLGLAFVGLDILGGFLTEVNSTSPMGIGEINTLYHSQSDKTVVKSLQQYISQNTLF